VVPPPVLVGNSANLHPEVGEVHVSVCVCVSVCSLSKLRKVS
jgi:hypothetical protein